MKLVNTDISKDCTRKVFVYVDKNGHYHIDRYFMFEGAGWAKQNIGRSKFKHIESANRAVAKWIGKV